MESSDSSLSSEWDMVIQKEIEDSSFEIDLNGTDEVKEASPIGSAVHVLTEEDNDQNNDTLSEANVSHHNEILNETETNNHNDSNSSSDIDVIEEGDEDIHHNRMLLSPINFLSTALAESGPLVPAITPAPAPNTEDRWNNFLLTHRLLRNPQFKERLIIIFISIAVASTMHLQGAPVDKIKQMKEQVDELKKENTDLKDRVISKIEDDKLFQTLEEQINTLKNENLKLSSSLESLIFHLQEQTESFKKDHKIKDKNPYQIEIDRLREQVNLLKIDNDDLQQQLVRMRYGAFSSHFDDAKDDYDKIEVKPDQKQDAQENTSDILTKQIEKLKRKLYSEVNDLKEWKKSIDILIKQLNENEKKDNENQDGLNFKKASDNGKHTKEETHEKKKKEKSYDWSWKEFKKNFGGTFDNINFSDMLSKYVNVNEKKVKDTFETIGNYFKKAQEKTKDMFKRYNQKGKKEAWDILETLTNKWATMKHKFYENHNKKEPVPPKHESRKFASDFSGKPSKFKNEEQKFREDQNTLVEHFFPDAESRSNFLNQRHKIEFIEHMMKNEFLFGSDPDIEKFFEGEGQLSEQGKKPENSWLFRRAASRSVLRDQDEEDDYAIHKFENINI